MVRTKITVNIPTGFHLRPVSILCDRALDFTSHITIRMDHKSVNGKSVLGVLSACVKAGDEIELICEGPDESEAIEVLSHMIQSGLGDEFKK